MKRLRIGSSRRLLWLLLLFQAGCGSVPVPNTLLAQPTRPAPTQVDVTSPSRANGDSAIVQLAASAQSPRNDPAPGNEPSAPNPGDCGLGSAELSLEALVQQILARNQNLARMVAAMQAAAARYPQVTALDDPTVAGFIGPASIGSRDVDFAYRVEASQRIPFPGKRQLRGQSALAESAAAANDVDETRLELIESARMAYYDYYLAHAALAVNEEGLQLLRDLRKTAEDRVRANQAPQQDLLQAEVEIGRQRERILTLERTRKVAVARLNTLMHLPPDSRLPPPPKEVNPPVPLPPVEQVRAIALAQRPDLQALSNRVAAEEASLALARKEYYPDFEVMAAYDAFWQSPEKDLRPQVGLRVNVPVQRDRRRGAVAEAAARVAQRRAELEARVDQIHFQVQEAYEQTVESDKAVRLYDDSLLPAARRNVEAARAAYIAKQIPFLSLIEAQRGLIDLRNRSYELQADYHRRRATLERAAGGLVSPLAGSDCPPPR